MHAGHAVDRNEALGSMWWTYEADKVTQAMRLSKDHRLELIHTQVIGSPMAVNLSVITKGWNTSECLDNDLSFAKERWRREHRWGRIC